MSDAPAGSRASVWDTLAAMKARHSAAERGMEREKETLRVRRDGCAALDRAFAAAAAAGETDGARVIADALRPGARDPAVDAALRDATRVLGEGGAAAREREVAEVVLLQERAVLDLEKAKTVLCRIADDREIADSRAGRLEYKVRD
jgi:hypothetical protein